MEETFHVFRDGKLSDAPGEVVQEYPVVLRVNDREIATLIASPHDLRFLVAGFLRLQGFVESVSDFLMLSVCTDFGIANVRVRKELPERLKPVLTSGCGTGVTFTLPQKTIAAVDRRGFTPRQIFGMMEKLNTLTERYATHGGIHSAAVGDGDSVLLHAEDIGRHNTLDRIAGEALLKGIDISGLMLVTSGRVSTELAAKASVLGIPLIASRTSPTDMAIKLCREAGITLVGYVRGGKFTVYSNPQGIDVRQGAAPPSAVPLSARIPGVTAAILAGGKSSRMGSNKALLPYKGGRFIEAIHRQLSAIFDEVLVVTNSPEQYDFLPCRKVPDVEPGHGALSGIHSAVLNAAHDRIFVVGCDMPYLRDDLVRLVAGTSCPEDGVVIPQTEAGAEPLHALYGKGCAEAIERAMQRGSNRVVSFFGEVTVNRIHIPEGEEASFRNINTPQEYYELRDGESVKEEVPRERRTA